MMSILLAQLVALRLDHLVVESLQMHVSGQEDGQKGQSQQHVRRAIGREEDGQGHGVRDGEKEKIKHRKQPRKKSQQNLEKKQSEDNLPSLSLS